MLRSMLRSSSTICGLRMFWHKYGVQVTGTSMGAALLGQEVYHDHFNTGAALLIRHVLDIAETQGVNLTGAMWSRSPTGSHLLTLASGGRQLCAEFAPERLAMLPSRDTTTIHRTLQRMVEELGTPPPQLAPESVEKYVF